MSPNVTKIYFLTTPMSHSSLSNLSNLKSFPRIISLSLPSRSGCHDDVQSNRHRHGQRHGPLPGLPGGRTHRGPD